MIKKFLICCFGLLFIGCVSSEELEIERNNSARIYEKMPKELKKHFEYEERYRKYRSEKDYQRFLRENNDREQKKFMMNK